MNDTTPTVTVLGQAPDAPRPEAGLPHEPCGDTSLDVTDEAQDWSWVSAAPFRAHVRRVLTAEPIPWRAFAGYARVPDNVIRGLLGLGRRPVRRIAPHYAHALLSIDSRNLRADLVRPVEPDTALLATRALLAAGWTVSRIARAGSLAEPRLRALLAGEDLAVTQRTALLLAAAARAYGVEVENVDVFDAAATPLAA